MSIPDPAQFSQAWLTAFNSHDLEAVLAHFHDEVLFTSPLAARVVPESGGVIRGKGALRAYWNKALIAVPELHFELVDVYVGISTIVVIYRNHTGEVVAEVLRFDTGLVVEGHATHRG